VTSLCELLGQLAQQTLSPTEFEVLVVDDGSSIPVKPAVMLLDVPFPLRVLSQANAGQAAARHAALAHARGALAVVIDDDMRVGPTFLAEHIASHPDETRRVVLGRICSPPGRRPPLFERWRLHQMQKLSEDVRAGRATVRGYHLYTGNVSFRVDDYLAVGGFDPALRLSEDAELGIRLERAGAEFVLCESAAADHADDATSLDAWMRRSAAYGRADALVGLKHPGDPSADPWRFYFLMHPASRPSLLLSALAPRVAQPMARAAMYVAIGMAWLGAERIALAGTTVAYGMQYFSGVRAQAGTRRATFASLRHHRLAQDTRTSAPMSPSTSVTS
jgi:GT2 family glycosyltransferase